MKLFDWLLEQLTGRKTLYLVCRHCKQTRKVRVDPCDESEVWNAITEGIQ